jgi:hypothetical protein
MFSKDIWCLLFQNYFDSKTYINCYYAAKSLRRFMTLNQINTCERYSAFKRDQIQHILTRTHQLMYGLCSICGKRCKWSTLSKHQRACKQMPFNLRADHCEQCNTVLPFVKGLPHHMYYSVTCPFDKFLCKLCGKTVLRIEDQYHDGCEVNCRRCGLLVPTKNTGSHVCLEQCNAIITKRVRKEGFFNTGYTMIKIKCSRGTASNSIYCFQHGRKPKTVTSVNIKK